MKKFKLIQIYPGSPKLGTVLTPKVDEENTNTNNFYSEGSWFNPNDFSEYWEEVIEKDYEIVAMKIYKGIILEFKDGICVKRSDEISPNSTTCLKKILEQQPPEDFIYSVKRLSDGEVFTVGDYFDVGVGSRAIKSIWVDEDGHIRFTHENGGYDSSFEAWTFSVAKKTSPVIFTTDDGVGMRKGDIYYFVDIDGSSVDMRSTTQFSVKVSGYAYFSTQEKAVHYLIRNKPCLSIDDIERVFKLSRCHLESLIKSVKGKIC